MANLKGVDIKKGRMGANRLSGNDPVSGIIIGASVGTDLLALHTATVAYNMRDVQLLGVTDNFDKTNNINVFRHCSEFYAMAGEGTPLYLMLVPQSAEISEIVETDAKKLLAFAKGEIRQLGIAVNPQTAPQTMIDGLPADVFNGIAKAQGLCQWAYDNNMPCQILLEGHHYGGQAATSANIRELENLNADKVSVVIGQDWLYAEGLSGERKKFADVGTALGTLSRAKVHENIGDNSQFNLTDATRGRWLEPGLSSHQTNV